MYGAREITQQLGVLTVPSGDLGSVPNTHTVVVVVAAHNCL